MGLVVCLVERLYAPSAHSTPPPVPVVEAEYQVYDMSDPNNGAGPMWCYGKVLRPAHTSHAEIRQNGGGRFSHWKTLLYFSTTDGSAPRKNGRKYTRWIDE
ncbi:MAG: hypothetical protein NTV49_04845 [Kiritimatiellaeota bacterium]|nr:hypothetical protein [Kiritimatiellota bacterium]